MPHLTPEGRRVVADLASRHGIGVEAALALLDSLALGNGTQAQFNHPDLGGMGQWSRGGMIMIGDMFNQGLKYRVDALCNDLAGLLRSEPSLIYDPGRTQSQNQGAGGTSLFVQGSGSGGRWWPQELGDPASAGAQNDLRYAFFPGSRRIAIQQGGRLRVYDSGEHRLSGFSQQQGGDQSLTFTSQIGVVRLADLPEVAAESAAPSSPAAPAPPPTAAASPHSVGAAATPQQGASEILSLLESLAGLRDKRIISEEEFAAKKAELLSRL